MISGYLKIKEENIYALFFSSLLGVLDKIKPNRAIIFPKYNCSLIIIGFPFI